MRLPRRALLSVLLAAAPLLALASPARGDDDAKKTERFVVVASTTSTENSGLFAHVLPRFERKTGIDVRVVAVGTGQAIRLAERGDADVLLVHHRASEEKFVRDGFGVERHDLMANDFVLVGPLGDPANVRGGRDAAAALRAIAATPSATFVSRGDDSGTHKRELELWAAADLDPEEALADRYRATGSGMGATLNMANELGAYALADRGTWLSFENRDQLAVLVSGDERLLNPYGVIVVSEKRHPHVHAEDARLFVDWLLSDEGRAAIESFQVNGETLFHPAPSPKKDAKKEPSKSAAGEPPKAGG